jgi:hypothetical protein
MIVEKGTGISAAITSAGMTMTVIIGLMATMVTMATGDETMTIESELIILPRRSSMHRLHRRVFVSFYLLLPLFVRGTSMTVPGAYCSGNGHTCYEKLHPDTRHHSTIRIGEIVQKGMKTEYLRL